ncbi:MAG: methionyl-tRNA synthetase [Planctomycetota bacterium]|jgi:methionyl-tRNA synthetase
MSSKKQPIYITTTLPYVNADPHIGFAMEIIRADTMVRYYRLMGHEVFFNTGTDEHGQKVHTKALEAGRDTLEYVDEYAERFRGLIDILGLSDDVHFVRTTDAHHQLAAQEIWRRCDAGGFIYKKNYQTKYCVGCELEKTDSEIENDRCAIHTNFDLELVDEENYFFKFSVFGEQLLAYYGENPTFVRPDFRLNEIRAFVGRGLLDFSISRLQSKMPWGVPVPNDTDHVMYVWFDALTSYISTLGWPEDAEGNFAKFWEQGRTIQYAGKDNLRQQSAMWQAMLLAAGLPLTDQVIIGGFINTDGQKMSKSLGNVLSPYTIVEKYGTDALRYYLLRHVSSYDDSDVTMAKFHESYTAHLVNGIGNLTSRVMQLAETHLDETPELPDKSIPDEWIALMEEFDIQKAADLTWLWISNLDRFIAEEKPYQIVKTDIEKGKEMIRTCVVNLHTIGWMLHVLLPETSRVIKETVAANKKPQEPLFPRIESA